MSPRRLWIVVLLLTMGAVVVAGRSTQVMVIEHDRWTRKAHNQHRRVISVPGRRGEIRSADGYVLATTVDRVAIQVNTGHLRYPELFARSAAPVLGCTVEKLSQRLGGKSRAVWLAQRATRDTAETVRAFAPAAIALVPDSERLYPLGRTAAPVVGFVGREELVTIGRTGLEHHYDEVLRGEPDQYLAVHDAVQRQLRLERLEPGRAGYDLELTLHARLQAACELQLEAAVERLQAKAASAVVLEASSGDLVAVASIPSFDLSRPGEAGPECWRLRPVQDALEPGSTVKPLVAAIAMSAGAVLPDELFDCNQHGLRIAGVWIRDHAEPGTYSLDEIITLSSNAGIIQVAERLPPDLMWKAFVAFGFGQRSGLGFPGETQGVLFPPERWSRVSRAGLAIGQELTASPLQLALAYAAIANGGWLPRPRLVRRASGDDGELPTESRWRRRVMDEELAARLRHMLETVVTEGTGKLAALSVHRAAGKTGTAQRAVAGRFDDRHHVSWFAGMFPIPEPRFVVVVAVDEPQADYWASTVAAPLFAALAEETARCLDIPAGKQQRSQTEGGAST